MDAMNIILEFDSPNREIIEKDIYNEERGCVDFSVLLPYPLELDDLVSGSSEDEAIELVKEHQMNFDTKSVSLKQDVRDFILKNREDAFFLEDKFLDEKRIESIVKNIVAYQKYGHPHWMSYKEEKWGVSRNAFLYAGGKKKRTPKGGFYFVTSYSIPKQWLLELSRKWEDVIFEVYCRKEFSERNGNVSVYHFLNGTYKRIADVKRKF